MKFNEMGKRMKEYEYSYDIRIPRRVPIILRLDGKAFHNLTRNLEKPFDMEFIESMNYTAKCLLEEINDSEFAYVQSDEISLLLTNNKSLCYEPYFNNKLQKIVSVAASIATAAFNDVSPYEQIGLFDCRAFILPEKEVCNYFIWRQKDFTRNSLQSVARSLYSHKQLNSKKSCQLHEMIFEKGINWNELPISLRRGRCAVRNCNARNEITIDNDIPVFTEDRNYIERFVYVKCD